ncbi:MAG: shikimate kinase [Planctomycetota bacterium]
MKLSPLTRPFDVELTLPGSKSQANRTLIAAALTEGRTIIENATPCDDVARMVDNLAAMGFDITWIDRRQGTVSIVGGVPTREGEATLDCGHAGTTLRFLTSLCCLVPGRWTLSGSKRLRERPIEPLVAALRQLGAEITDQTGSLPLTIRGGTLRGGKVSIDGRATTQFASALRLVAPAVPGGIQVEVKDAGSVPYLELTENVLSTFAASPVHGTSTPRRISIEGDWSAAGAFLVLAKLTGSRLRPTNLSANSAQGDRALPELIASMRGPGNREIDCRGTPDQLMNLSILAARRRGTTRFVGAASLRLKECDRLAVLTRELRKAGIDIEENDDGVTVHESPQLRAASLDPHDDHRMAMAFALLATLHPGIEILDPGCVSKSYPAFFEVLEKLHRAPLGFAFTGMRGAGKSTLGRRWAAAQSLPFIDTDEWFEQEYGSISSFVEENGWPAFRALEEDIVQSALGPGRVVALGGGSSESPTNRHRLKEGGLTIFIDESLSRLEARISIKSRPALTQENPVAELSALLEKRRPIYRDCAEITLPSNLTTEQQVSRLFKELEARCSW